MNIHYISTSPLPSTQANAVQVMKMCGAFSGNGHAVTLFAREGDLPGDLFAFYGVKPVFEIIFAKWRGVRGIRSFDYACQIRKSVKEIGAPDVFYSRNALVLCTLLRRYPDVPGIFEAHVLPSGFLHRWIEERLLRRAARLVVISQVLKDDYLNLFPWLSADKILVAHDGADPAPENAVKNIALPGRAKVIRAGYAGRLIAGKGADLIVRLASSCPEIDFHLFGGSPEEIATYKKASSDNIFFHGHIPHGELQNYYPLMDVMLAPLQVFMLLSGKGYDIARWTSPLKIFEYMSFGKPIIASDLPVLREVLQDDRNAVFCPPDLVSSWAATLERLAADPQMREKIGNAARQDFLNNYTWQARAANVIKF